MLGPWEEFLRLYSEAHRACLDHTTTDLVFRSLRKRVGAELGGVVKKQRVEEGAGPPVVLLTGISQSISRRLREVNCQFPSAPHLPHTHLFLRLCSSWEELSVTDHGTAPILSPLE